MCFLEGTEEAGSAESRENGFDVSAVFFKGLGPDDDVVQVDVTDRTNVGAEGGEHAALVRRWGVAAALGHYGPLVKPEGGGDSGVFDVVGVYAGLKEGIGHVDF